ncbi:haloacid dehalogenase-like hydrolase, partial [Candidatus Kaiserbacteria bacterium]|nr:haloacid dehalogenase-like hydrolase [Candidatus Kaiserbacteria bacterium]
MKPVAFFDIDGTVFRSSLLIELVEQLVNEGVFPYEAMDLYSAELQAWRSREGTYEKYIQAVIRSFLKNIKGVHYGEFADIGRHVVETQSKHVYRYTRDLIKELKHEGYYLV